MHFSRRTCNEGLNWHSASAGLIFLALIISISAAPVIGELMDKYSAGYPTATGAFYAFPLYSLLALPPRNRANLAPELSAGAQWCRSVPVIYAIKRRNRVRG